MHASPLRSFCPTSLVILLILSLCTAAPNASYGQSINAVMGQGPRVQKSKGSRSVKKQKHPGTVKPSSKSTKASPKQPPESTKSIPPEAKPADATTQAESPHVDAEATKATPSSQTATPPQIDFGTENQGELGYMRVLTVGLPDMSVKATKVTLVSVSSVDWDQAQINMKDIPVGVDHDGKIASGFVTITKNGDSDSTNDFKVATDCPTTQTASCLIVIGFIASKAGDETAQLNFGDVAKNQTILLKGAGSTETALASPSFSSNWMPLNRYSFEVNGSVDKKEAKALELKVLKDFDAPEKMISNFYHGDSSKFAAFTQATSVYNPSAGSATISADLATLDFFPGIEVGVGAKAQTGSGNAVAPATPGGSSQFIAGALRTHDASSITPPTLSYAQAAQGAQNLANGGNLVIHAMYPLLFTNPDTSDKYSLIGVVRARDGVDIPNFAGTNTVITDPVNHFSAMTEWNFRFDAITPSNGSGGGSIFIDGSAGYDYTNHSFARQNGWGNRSQFLLGQLAGGIIFTNTVSIGFLRNFGPAQSYVDSTTNLPTTVNQFQTWSLSITYTKKAATPSATASAK